MAVENTNRKITYQGNGLVNVFSIPFPFISKDDIKVATVDPSGVFAILLSGYYVDPVAKTVTYPYGTEVVPTLPSGWELLIYREIPLTQNISLPNNGAFLAKTHESGFDKLTMITQQLQEEIDRCLKFGISSNVSDATADDIINQAKAEMLGVIKTKNIDGGNARSIYTDDQQRYDGGNARG